MRQYHGTFSKTSSTALDRLLHLSKQGAPIHEPEAATLLLEYGVKRGLLSFRDNGYAACHGAVLGWLREPIEKRHADFLDLAVRATVSWRHRLLLEALGKPDCPWLSVKALDRGGDSGALAAAHLLAYAGLAATCARGDDVVFAQAPEAHSIGDGAWMTDGPRAMVLPDFSALLPQEISPDQLYWFMRVGTVVSLDKVYHGRIDRRTINESLCQGVEGDALVEQLVRWQAPGNVVETVREWIREFSRVYLCSETFLVSADEKVSAQISSFEPLKDLVEPVPAHQVFRVRPGRQRQVEEMLFGLGFDPRMPQDADESGEQPDEGPPARENGSTDRRPVVRFVKAEKEAEVSLKSGKYSPELKKLDTNEMLHVIDYAMLMGQPLRIEYGGSPGLKKGIYRLVPLSVEKGHNPVVAGEVPETQTKRKFLVKEIERLGVESQ